MSLPPQEGEKDERIQSKSRSISAPIPSPPALQWVSVGKGGRTSNIRSVRSHVSKEYHHKKREIKRANLQRLSLQKDALLLPGRVFSENITDTEQSRERHDTSSTQSESGALVGRKKSAFHSPTMKVQYSANLIPYAWFENDGPVLHVNRSTWPFPAPLHVTASDRRSDVERTLSPRQSAWMPYTRKADYTPVNGAILDFKVLLWIGQSPECFQFRVEFIKWIQDQLDDPIKAISDNTIGSIMTFAMWTAGYGDPLEMTSHMDAVERIVKLRGEFHRFQDDGPMVEKLKLFDAMIAVQTGEPTRFPPVYYSISQPLTPTFHQSTIYYESPLFGCGEFEKIIRHHKTQDTIINLLNKMWTLTWSYETSCSEPAQTEATTTHEIVPYVPDKPYAWRTHLLTLPILSRCTDSSHNHVLETLLSASVIYARTLTNPNIDFPSTINDKAFGELCTAFGKCSHDAFWVVYPGILLWVLLIGTAVARAKKEAAFWMFYLSRSGSFPDAENWLAGNSAIQRFLEIQSWMRKTGAG